MNTSKPLPLIESLPQLDTDAVTAEAAEWITDALDGLDGASAIARAAAELCLEAETHADRFRRSRDAAVATIDRKYKLKRGANLAGALGVERSRLMVIRRKNRKAKHRMVPDAVATLPTLARAAAFHAACADAARNARDAAVDVLLAEGKTNAEVAELIGVDPSRVSHLKHRGDEREDGSDED